MGLPLQLAAPLADTVPPPFNRDPVGLFEGVALSVSVRVGAGEGVNPPLPVALGHDVPDPPPPPPPWVPEAHPLRVPNTDSDAERLTPSDPVCAADGVIKSVVEMVDVMDFVKEALLVPPTPPKLNVAEGV